MAEDQDRDRPEKNDKLVKLLLWGLQGLWTIVFALMGVVYNQTSVRLGDTEKDLQTLRIQYTAHEAADKVRLEAYAAQFSTVQKNFEDLKVSIREMSLKLDRMTETKLK